jgi:hypothetical protein
LADCLASAPQLRIHQHVRHDISCILKPGKAAFRRQPTQRSQKDEPYSSSWAKNPGRLLITYDKAILMPGFSISYNLMYYKIL